MISAYSYNGITSSHAGHSQFATFVRATLETGSGLGMRLTMVYMYACTTIIVDHNLNVAGLWLMSSSSWFEQLLLEYFRPFMRIHLRCILPEYEELLLVFMLLLLVWEQFLLHTLHRYTCIYVAFFSACADISLSSLCTHVPVNRVRTHA